MRRLAAAAVANIGPEAAAAVPELIGALGDADTQVKINAAVALSRIGPKAEPAIRPLAQALNPKEPALVRQYAAEALARIGQELEPAVPELLRVLKDDPEPKVRQRAVWALGRVKDIEDSGAAKALEAVLSEKSREMLVVRYEAARYLAYRLAAKTPPKAIDILVEMMSDNGIKIYTRTDTKVQSNGAETTGGTATAKENVGGDARCLPAEALGRAAAANRPDVIRVLEKALDAADPKLRDAAKEALKQIKE